MAGYSKILNSISSRFSTRSSILFSQKSNLLNNSIKCLNNQLVNQTRGSHARTMFIRPAGLPFFLFIAYQNFFVGPATLKEIPEDYEPKYWEYHKHPIKRFLARYFLEIPERAYEMNLHNIYVESCRIKMRQLESKVRNMMQEKQDYKAWYYVPVPKETMEMKQEELQKHGQLGYDPKYTK